YYASIITLSLNSAVSRYLTMELQNKNFIEANKTFNTANVISVLLIVILLPVAFGIAYFSDYIFQIPDLIKNDGKILFFFVILSFLVTVISNPFSASTYALNRLDLSNIINILNIVFRTVVVILLLVFLTPSLTMVGYSYFAGAILMLVGSIFISKKISPELKINFKNYNKDKYKSLTGMSVWLVINQLGTMLFVNIDLILINIIFGAYLQGEYAAILQMSILLRNLSFVISRVTGPMVYISYAKKEIQKLIYISKGSVKFMTLLLAFPIGLLCGFGSSFLNIWLGQDYIKYTPLLWLMTGHLIINLGIQPLYSISNACNKVRFPAIITLALGIINVILAILLAKVPQLGIYGVALAGALILTLKSTLFITIYSAHIIKINKMTFLKPLLPGLLLAFFIFAISYIINYYFSVDNWFLFLAFCSLISLLLLPLVWFIIIKKSERELLLSIFKKNTVKVENFDL
ncbi:MAG: oligosaccharide flippase family protein, partial [Bacteroidales bacterium]|nr:oligosaccharide flippase family protein [Bacteroidales bacterium]